MHDKLFGNFRKLSRENILAWAQELGMDMPRFTADLASANLKSVVQKDLKAGEEAGVTGTPSFYINGKHYNGPFSMAALKPIFDAELAPAKAQASSK
jgi:protein-disulfide isomerase